MLETTNARSGPYVSSGSNTEYPFYFPVLSHLHLAVYKDGERQAVNQYGTTHTTDGGSIRFHTPPAAGSLVAIVRDVPITQVVDLQNNTAFLPEVIEMALDRLTMICQQIREILSRTLTVPPTEDMDQLFELFMSIPDEAAAAASSAAAAAQSAITAAQHASSALASRVAAATSAAAAALNSQISRTVTSLPTSPIAGQLVRLTTADATAKAAPGAYMHDGVGWTCVSYESSYALGNLGATPSLTLIPGASYTATVDAKVTSFAVAFTRPGLCSITLTNASTLDVAQPTMADRTSKLLAEAAWDGAATALSRCLLEDDGTYLIASAGGLE